MSAAPEERTPPTRVVDGLGRGWYWSGGLYEADYGFRDGLHGFTLRQIASERGGWRPFVPPSENDVTLLHTHLLRAGPRAAGTVLVAAHAVARLILDTTGSLGPFTAGRGGSWESVYLREAVLDLGAQATFNPDVHDPDAAAVATGVIMRWVLHPDGYTEVAENLAVIFGHVADALGGWAEASTGALTDDERLQGYLMSTSVSYWRDRL